MCSLRIWWMGVGTRQRPSLPMVALWLCPGSPKPELQVERSKFTISSSLELVGIHLPAFHSHPRFSQGLSCYPVEECFIPDTAVVHRTEMHGSSIRPREAGRNQLQPLATGGTAHQFCFLFCRPATFPV